MIIRKFIGFLLSLLLLVSNTGMAVNVHYCGGQIAQVKSGYFLHSGCGMEMPAQNPEGKAPVKKCCDEKSVDLKTASVLLSAPYIAFDSGVFIRPSALEIPGFSRVLRCVPAQVSLNYSGKAEANGPPLYQLFSSFIFYA